MSYHLIDIVQNLGRPENFGDRGFDSRPLRVGRCRTRQPGSPGDFAAGRPAGSAARRGGECGQYAARVGCRGDNGRRGRDGLGRPTRSVGTRTKGRGLLRRGVRLPSPHHDETALSGAGTASASASNAACGPRSSHADFQQIADEMLDAVLAKLEDYQAVLNFRLCQGRLHGRSGSESDRPRESVRGSGDCRSTRFRRLPSLRGSNRRHAQSLGNQPGHGAGDPHDRRCLRGGADFVCRVGFGLCVRHAWTATASP